MENQTELEEPILRINDITFLQFCTHLRGKRLFNKKGSEVPKFIAFWSKVRIERIEERYNVLPR